MNDANKTVTNNIWQQRADTFWPGSTALQTKKIPPGIYRYEMTDNGWYLAKTSDRYIFPYKIYGVNESILSRIKRAWQGLSGNFGVLLNGLKGTGKTVTAQQIVNWAIDEGIMVLNVHSPIPLATVMAQIEQPMLVLFDEFEKTHDETAFPGAQQELLSAIDGLSRNEFRRLFLFTTNVKKVNDNLIDRPSRIRYNWEFGRVNNELIEMLIADILKPKLMHLKHDIFQYLNSRAVLTIDVVKTVINECNTFEESPEAFKTIMNLSEKTPGAFKVEIIDDLGITVEVSSWFKTNFGSWLISIMTKAGQQDFIERYVSSGSTQTINSPMGQAIEILGPTEKENEWICYVQMPNFKTWVGPKLEKESHDFLWLDEKPENWKIPEWARKIERSEKLTSHEENEMGDWIESDNVFGGTKRKKVRVRFTLDDSPFSYDPGRFACQD